MQARSDDKSRRFPAGVRYDLGKVDDIIESTPNLIHGGFHKFLGARLAPVVWALAGDPAKSPGKCRRVFIADHVGDLRNRQVVFLEEEFCRVYALMQAILHDRRAEQTLEPGFEAGL